QRPRKDIMAIVDMAIPCHRYGHRLEDCVARIVAQAIREFRGLIIDDASPDRSAAKTACR
ncbi:MAG: glycosyltransferase, partial [Hansschlegelia sp.]